MMRLAAIQIIRAIGAMTLILGVCSCSSKMPEWSAENEKPRVFKVSFRQTAPDPVYNRARWVHLPEIIPQRGPDTALSPLYLPIVHLQFKNLRAEEAARLIAATAQYSSYCASSFAAQTVSINSLGTIDELAEELANQLGGKAMVDHRSRHVSIVSNLPEVLSPEAPRFAGSDAVFDTEVGSPTQVLGAETGNEH